ncbi:uncharacterized protein P884DRAFT_299662 [Thermothelomyces heterothallicus CBS 202.75]|uniref:uncharacterized protein n=1 Tax=Thermothelomyces heterothallicus CBS 202.75 TaxID=1149848 RepID=UPI003743367A
MGCGFGLNLGTILVMVPLVVHQRDMLVTMGAATQIRVLGGIIGLAICSALLSNYVSKSHAASLGGRTAGGHFVVLAEHRGGLPPPQLQVEVRVRQAYAAGYGQQMRAMLYFSIASLVSLSLLAEWPPRRMRTTENGEIPNPEGS